MLLNNQWVIEEMGREIRNHPDTNKNGNTTGYSFLGHNKGKLIVLNTHTKKKRKISKNKRSPQLVEGRTKISEW